VAQEWVAEDRSKHNITLIDNVKNPFQPLLKRIFCINLFRFNRFYVNRIVMKVKHLLYIWCLFILVVACKDDKQLQPTFHELEVSTNTILFWRNAAADTTFTVTSDQPWTLSASADWVVLTPESGNPSKTPVTIRVSLQENPTEDPREADIIVSSGELTETVAVAQLLPPLYDFSVSELAFDAKGGQKTITLTWSNDWRITTNDWIKVSPESGKGSRNGVEITVNVEENTSKEERESNIWVRTTGSLAETLMPIKIKQSAAK
jgi:hypothetical protein